RIFGNAERRNDGTTERKDAAAASAGRPGRAEPKSAVPKETMIERRDRLDQELRRGLEQLGVVVRGADVARAVSAAVGKRIEWTA
ncbi:MAG: hypothetical protein AABY85_06105, partial [Gemmatimonadota bacterium]